MALNFDIIDSEVEDFFNSLDVDAILFNIDKMALEKLDVIDTESEHLDKSTNIIIRSFDFNVEEVKSRPMATFFIFN